MTDVCEIACVIGVAFNCNATADDLAQMLHEAVDFAARVNVRWYLEQFDHPTPEAFGYAEDAEWPPCCPGCAGIVHAPDPSGLIAAVELATRILSCGTASCGGAAAMAMGYEIALPIFEGRLSEEEAFARVQPSISYGSSPDGGARGRYFHARFMIDGEEIDPTKEMRAA
jgi:hypothetical protein